MMTLVLSGVKLGVSVQTQTSNLCTCYLLRLTVFPSAQTYLEAVSVCCLQDDRHNVFGRFAVVIGQTRGIPGHRHHS